MEVEHVECFQPAALLKVTLSPWVFSRFLNCTNDTNSRNALNYARVMETKLYLEILTVLWIKWAEIVGNTKALWMSFKLCPIKSYRGQCV